MSEALYKQLMIQFAAEHTLEVDRLIASEAIVLNGISFRFEYQELTPGQAHMLVFCQYGELPLGRIAEAAIVLLESNMVLYYNRGPGAVFTIAPGTREVWLMDSYALESLDSHTLGQYVQETSMQAHQWQRDYFLDG